MLSQSKIPYYTNHKSKPDGEVKKSSKSIYQEEEKKQQEKELIRECYIKKCNFKNITHTRLMNSYSSCKVIRGAGADLPRCMKTRNDVDNYIQSAVEHSKNCNPYFDFFSSARQYQRTINC